LLSQILIFAQENVSSQSHLQGCYSILANRHVHLTTDLLSAGFWNYLREDITASLIEHRSLMIDLSSQQISLDAGEEGQGDDANHANRVTFLLGKVINRCLAVDSPALTFEEWEVMKAELNNWKNSLAPSFEPIRTPGLRKGAAFAQIWTIRDWHGTLILRFIPSCLSPLSLLQWSCFRTFNSLGALSDPLFFSSC
jgi:hypothetical protein